MICLLLVKSLMNFSLLSYIITNLLMIYWSIVTKVCLILIYFVTEFLCSIGCTYKNFFFFFNLNLLLLFFFFWGGGSLLNYP